MQSIFPVTVTLTSIHTPVCLSLKATVSGLTLWSLYLSGDLSDEGIGSVMSAHINVPGLDATPRLPATFSRKVITGLLKEEIGYKGLVLTDAMNMAGATMTYPSGIADAEALKAGNDVIEYSTDPLRP